ncbi:MAG: sigma-70 family RNA polymerase sigma factor [Fimbriimonadia bacterium]|nr:sigma-70 family RNA polymerase sigma factor [Fimbriimonadia bacterium]
MKDHYAAVIEKALRIARRWRVPTHWERDDWCSEMRSIASLVVCEENGGRLSKTHDEFTDDWLFRKVLTALWSYHRKESKNSFRYLFESERFSDYETSSLSSEQLERILSLLEFHSDFDALYSELDAKDQELIRLYFFDELTEKEVSEKLGVSQPAVSQRKTKLIHFFRTFLDRDESR